VIKFKGYFRLKSNHFLKLIDSGDWVPGGLFWVKIRYLHLFFVFGDPKKGLWVGEDGYRKVEPRANPGRMTDEGTMVVIGY